MGIFWGSPIILWWSFSVTRNVFWSFETRPDKPLLNHFSTLHNHGKKEIQKVADIQFFVSFVVEFSFLKVRVASCTLKSKKKMLLIRSTNLIRKQKLVTFLSVLPNSGHCLVLYTSIIFYHEAQLTLSETSSVYLVYIHDAKCHNAIFPPHFEILQMPKFLSVVTKKFAGWNMNLEFASIFLTSREVSPPLIFFRLKKCLMASQSHIVQIRHNDEWKQSDYLPFFLFHHFLS